MIVSFGEILIKQIDFLSCLFEDVLDFTKKDYLSPSLIF